MKGSARAANTAGPRDRKEYRYLVTRAPIRQAPKIVVCHGVQWFVLTPPPALAWASRFGCSPNCWTGQREEPAYASLRRDADAWARARAPSRLLTMGRIARKRSLPSNASLKLRVSRAFESRALSGRKTGRCFEGTAAILALPEVADTAAFEKLRPFGNVEAGTAASAFDVGAGSREQLRGAAVIKFHRASLSWRHWPPFPLSRTLAGCRRE